MNNHMFILLLLGDGEMISPVFAVQELCLLPPEDREKENCKTAWVLGRLNLTDSMGWRLIQELKTMLPSFVQDVNRRDMRVIAGPVQIHCDPDEGKQTFVLAVRTRVAHMSVQSLLDCRVGTTCFVRPEYMGAVKWSDEGMRKAAAEAVEWWKTNQQRLRNF